MLKGDGLKCPYEPCDPCDAADEFRPVDPRDINPLFKSLLFTKATKELGDVRIISFRSRISEDIGETESILFFPLPEKRVKLPLFLPLFRLPGRSMIVDLMDEGVAVTRSD